MLQRLRRGEIWPLPGGGTAEEVVAVARELRMDFCFFDHWPGAPAKAKALGMATILIGDGHGKPLGDHIDIIAPDLLDFLSDLNLKDAA